MNQFLESSFDIDVWAVRSCYFLSYELFYLFFFIC